MVFVALAKAVLSLGGVLWLSDGQQSRALIRLLSFVGLDTGMPRLGMHVDPDEVGAMPVGRWNSVEMVHGACGGPRNLECQVLVITSTRM